MKKLFVCSDIHGFFDEWMSALNEAGFDINNSDHILVNCGDLLDRGKQANKCLKFVNDLPNDRKILICGNHELLMDDILYIRRHFAVHDYSNGTVNTIEQLTGIVEQYDGKNSSWVVQDAMIVQMRTHEGWNKYYKSTTMYAEVGPYIFVHGWIPADTICLTSYPPKSKLQYRMNWRDVNYNDWKIATWTNGMSAWNDGVVEQDKTIVCGHWHTSWGHANLHNHGIEWDDAWAPDDGLDHNAYFEPFEDKGIICMDGCVAHSGQVNVKVLEVSDDEWTSKIMQ